MMDNGDDCQIKNAQIGPSFIYATCMKIVDLGCHLTDKSRQLMNACMISSMFMRPNVAGCLS